MCDGQNSHQDKRGQNWLGKISTNRRQLRDHLYKSAVLRAEKDSLDLIASICQEGADMRTVPGGLLCQL